jgi:rhodanese-related sulfurtransferase
VLCRRGIDSVKATDFLLSKELHVNDTNTYQPEEVHVRGRTYISNIFNIAGGLTAWWNEIDPNFPSY